MKITTKIEEVNDLLNLYSGARFEVYLFYPTFKRMLLKFKLNPNSKEVMYYVSVGSERIKGTFSFENSNFKVIEYYDDVSKERKAKIFDKDLRFELTSTGGYALAVGLESEFGSTFETFLNDGHQNY
jgi:hypothetical protein